MVATVHYIGLQTCCKFDNHACVKQLSQHIMYAHAHTHTHTYGALPCPKVMVWAMDSRLTFASQILKGIHSLVLQLAGLFPQLTLSLPFNWFLLQEATITLKYFERKSSFRLESQCPCHLTMLPLTCMHCRTHYTTLQLHTQHTCTLHCTQAHTYQYIVFITK